MNVYYNAICYTMEREGDSVEAFVEENGRIVWTGCNEEALSRFQGVATFHDLKKRTVLPTFIDSHGHLLGYGEMCSKQSLQHFRTKQSLLSYLQLCEAELEEEEWLIAAGYETLQFTDGELTVLDLSKAFPTRPVVLHRICRHSLFANEAALNIANVTSQMSHPPGGTIGKDKNEQLNGYMYESAADIVKQCVPKPSLQRQIQWLRTAIKQCYQYGISGFVTEDLAYYGDWKTTWRSYEAVLTEQKLPFHIHTIVHHHVAFQAMATISKRTIPEFLEIQGVKVFLDGSLGSETAWLSKSYTTNEGNYGLQIHSSNELDEIVEKARKQDCNVAFHMIGDAALDEGIRVVTKYPPKKGRDRFIHVSLCRDDQLKQLQQLPVIFDLQPPFLYGDGTWLRDRIGYHRAHLAYRWRDFLRSGIPCGGGADVPIEPLSPWIGLYCAVTQKDKNGKVYDASQRLTRYEAIQLYTTGSAQTIGKETLLGKIKVGYSADFQLYEKDPFKEPIESWIENNPSMCVVNGTIVKKEHVS